MFLRVPRTSQFQARLVRLPTWANCRILTPSATSSSLQQHASLSEGNTATRGQFVHESPFKCEDRLHYMNKWRSKDSSKRAERCSLGARLRTDCSRLPHLGTEKLWYRFVEVIFLISSSWRISLLALMPTNMGRAFFGFE